MPDISRSTFRREKHYDTVRMQQGRVLLDADQNESEDIHRYLRETTARDIIGRTGAPRDDAGFRIAVSGGRLFIGPGRMYVDGILCENDSAFRVIGTSPSPTTSDVDPGEPIDDDDVIAATLRSGKDATIIDPNRTTPAVRSITVAEWAAARFTKGAMVEIIGIQDGAPATATSMIDIVNTGARTFSITPAPSFTTVHFVRVMTPWAQQPDFFGGTFTTDKSYLVYLDVWKRDITTLEDPDLRELALGGPDTTTRTKVVWQVRTAPIGECVNFAPARSDARMAAKAVAPASPKTPCEIPEAAGYRRLENQLYRIEIHKPGGPGVATFKWSRENASIVFPVDPSLVDAKKLKLRTIGLDDRTMLHDGDHVEFVNDLTDLDAKPGAFAKVEKKPEASERVVTLSAVPPNFAKTRNARLRVWADPDVTSPEQTVDTTQFVPIEDGIQVQFSGTTFNTGDYWLIPARTAVSQDTGTILWPVSGSTPLFLPPDGITHHYAALAEVRDGVVQDCRRIFAPITTPDLFYVSGDGQEVMPTGGLVLLPEQLRVRVSNGTPIAGARVQFTLPAGQLGNLAVNSANGIAVTDANGIATCTWSVNSNDLNQFATARLVTPDFPDVAPFRPHIEFHAQLSIAGEVAYTPGCDYLRDRNVTTVQQALDELCRRPSGAGPCSIVIVQGEDVEGRLREIEGIDDVEICFAAGEFRIPRPVVVRNKRVKMTGAGAATRILSEEHVGIEFMECEDVLVRDLTFSAARPFGSFAFFIPSVLTFMSCTNVDVEAVSASCASDQTAEQTGCITTAGCINVRIRDCDISAGTNQYGLIVLSPELAILEGNRIAGRPLRIIDRDFEGDFDIDRRFTDVRTDIAAPRARTRDVSGGILVGPIIVAFTAPDDLKEEMRTLMREDDPRDVRNGEQARAAINASMKRIAADPERLRRFPAIERFFAARITDQGGAAFGIYVRASEEPKPEITIRDNDVRGAHTAITVNRIGLRDPEVDPSIRRAVIINNDVQLFQHQASGATRLIGIAVGACDSFLIEGNSLQAFESNIDITFAGIYHDAALGPFAIVRANDIRNFRTAAVLAPITKPDPHQWRITANFASGSTTAWDAEPKLWVIEDNVPPP